MRIIDFHQHLSVNSDLDDYLKMLSRNNIGHAVAIPYDFLDISQKEVYGYAQKLAKPRSYINFLKKLDLINESFLGYAKNCKKITPAAWFSPECNNLDSFIGRVKIVKFIPVLDNYDNSYFSRIETLVEKIISKGKIVMVHTGWGINPCHLNALALKYPKGIFVNAHMKEDDDSYNAGRFSALKNNPNLFCEISYFPHAKRIMQYANAGLGKRLIFGSDYRNYDDEQTIRGYAAMLGEADINPDVKAGIFYDNARDLLGLDY
jgi:hypothetical protein